MTARSQGSSVEPPASESQSQSSIKAEVKANKALEAKAKAKPKPNSDDVNAAFRRDVHIARATPSDQKALYDLELRCFDPGMAFHHRQIKDLLRNPRADVWIMCYRSQIIAQIIVLRRKFRDGIHARIYSLTVDLDYRGRGLSRTLLLHVLDELRAKSIRNVYLEVESDAVIPIALYGSFGFVQHHVLTDYYDRGRHGIKMRKVLE